MADDSTLVLYSPDSAPMQVQVGGETTYTSDATGKVSGIDPAHKDALLAHGLVAERPKKG